MENSIERPNFEVVFGDMSYDAKTEQIECPPTTVNNRKKLPQKGREIPEGEVSIQLGYCEYQKDENGKITNVKFLNKESKEEVEEQLI